MQTKSHGTIKSTIYHNRIFVKISLVKDNHECLPHLDSVQLRTLKLVGHVVFFIFVFMTTAVEFVLIKQPAKRIHQETYSIQVGNCRDYDAAKNIIGNNTDRQFS